MISALILSLAELLVGQAADETNPLYRQLRDNGVRLSDDVSIELTLPLLRDGASPEAARESIAKIAAPSYTFAQFARKSAVAPQILRIEHLDEGAMPARRVDVYFIAYGDLDEIAEGDVLERLLSAEESDDDAGGQGTKLDAQALAQAGIELAPEGESREAYAHGTYTLLKRVEIEGTVRTAWSREGHALVAAVELDPRFADDAELANRWRPLVRDDAGRLVPGGAAQPYRGVGGYVQLTELSEPAGALLVEWHLAFAEPHGWFDGANLLGSKLPAIVQNRVRAMRRELAAPSRTAP